MFQWMQEGRWAEYALWGLVHGLVAALLLGYFK